MVFLQQQLGSTLIVAMILCLLSSSILGFMLLQITLQHRIMQNYQVDWQNIALEQRDKMNN